MQLELFGPPAPSSLTPEQTRALVAAGSETLVIAAAGSGKTKLLIERLFWALGDGDDRAIVALTFSEKAAEEMQQRAAVKAAQLPKRLARAFARRVTIMTIDGFCLELLSEYPLYSNWSADRLLPADDLNAFLKQQAFVAAHEQTLTSAAIGLEVAQLPGALAALITLRRLRRGALNDPRLAAALVQSAQRAALAELAEIMGSLGQQSRDLGHLLAGVVLEPPLFCQSLDAVQAAIFKRRLGPDGAALRHRLDKLQRRVALFVPAPAERAQAFARLEQLADDLLQRYQRWKQAHRAFDFADLEHALLAVLEQTTVGPELAESIGHLLIDEVQDTNPLQEALLSCLSTAAKVFRVGDPRQAIYGFRDADVDAIFAKQQALPADAHFELTVNHRSLPPILAVANEFWAATGDHAESFLAMVASRHALVDPPELVLVHKGNESAKVSEAAWVAYLAEDECRRTSSHQVAVLCRTTADAIVAFNALQARGVSASLRVKTPLADTPAYGDAVALLQAFDQLDDDLALYGALRTGVFGCTLAEVRTLHAASEGTLAIAALPGLTLTGQPARVRQVFLELALSGRAWPRQQLLAALLGRSGLGAQGLAFAPVLECLALTDGLGLPLDEVIARLATATVEEVRGQSDGVQVMTIHGAKGLEWKSVILPFIGRRFEAGQRRGEVLSIPKGVATLRGSWPDDELMTALEVELRRRDRQEEFRLTYVALTRARDRLLLVGMANKKKQLNNLVEDQTCLLDVLRWMYDFTCPAPGSHFAAQRGESLLRVRGVASRP